MEEAVEPPQEHDGTTSRPEGILQVVYEGCWAFRADGVLEGEAALRNGRCRSCRTTATARALSPSHRRCRPAASQGRPRTSPHRRIPRSCCIHTVRFHGRDCPPRSAGRRRFDSVCSFGYSFVLGPAVPIHCRTEKVHVVVLLCQSLSNRATISEWIVLRIRFVPGRSKSMTKLNGMVLAFD